MEMMPVAKRANGQGNITPYKGGRYRLDISRYEVDENGEVVRVRFTKVCKTKKECNELAYKFTHEEIHRNKTLAAYWPRFRKKKDGENVHPATYQRYIYCFEQLKPFVTKEISDLRLEDLQRLIDNMPRSTAKNANYVARSLMNYAIVDGLMQTNYADFVDIPKSEHRERMPLKAEEVSGIWNAWAENSAYYASFALLMIYTGMMPGEVLDCCVENINVFTRQILYVGKKTAVRKHASIDYPPILDAVVASIIANADPKTGRIYRGPKKYTDAWEILQKEAGLRKDLQPYCCRHTTGTTLAEMNIALPKIQQVMRHASARTTEIYIHLNEEDKKETLENLNNFGR